MTYVGRFAPSPTGPLHLGSLATAVGSYLDARLQNGKWLVRIEDIDQDRCDPHWSADILHTLRAHGLKWDEPPSQQSARGAIYNQTLAQLAARNLTYPCSCTRKDIDAANANRPAGQNRIYPGTCAQGMPPGKTARAIRFRAPKTAVEWKDHRLGHFQERLQTVSGDFVLRRGDGFWAYHLAVVADDLNSGVTHVVRGEDLASSTACHVALFNALGSPTPNYWHLPVILADDGQKLSKQTGARALDCSKPLANLNRVWHHFGLGSLTATNCNHWLNQAVVQWAQYRAVR